MSDKYRARSLGKINWIVVWQIHENRQDANVNIHKIAYTLPHHRVAVPRESLAPLDHRQIECFFSAEILLNQGLYFLEKISILEK